MKYANEFIPKLGMGDPTKCVYQIIYNENNSDETNILQYFIIYELVLCIKLDSYVSHMVYAVSFTHNTKAPIAINKNKYFFP